MYSLDPGRCAYLPWHNENLLDNWYFVGGGSQQGGGQFPINQKGQTSYARAVYGIDRWKNVSSTTTIQLLSFGLQISNTSDIEGGLMQYLESNFSGKKVTLSLLISQITGSVKLWARNNSTWGTYGNTADANSPGLLSLTADITDYSSGNLVFYLDFSSSSSSQNSVTITAAKLELGTRSTLARLVDGEWVLNDPPPNFQQELAKCQRYLFDPFMGFNGYAELTNAGFVYTQTVCVFSVFFPENMRVFPSLIGNDFSMFRIGSTINGVFNSQIPVTNIIIQNWASNRVLLFVTTSQSLDIGAPCTLWAQQDSGSPPPILFSAEL